MALGDRERGSEDDARGEATHSPLPLRVSDEGWALPKDEEAPRGSPRLGPAGRDRTRALIKGPRTPAELHITQFVNRLIISTQLLWSQLANALKNKSF